MAERKPIHPMIEKAVDAIAGVVGSRLDIQSRRQCTPEQSLRWYQIAYAIQDVLNTDERFKEAVYWLLINYLATQRMGFEPGLTEEEATACILDYFTTIGLSPNTDPSDPEPAKKAQEIIDYFQSELPPQKHNKVLEDILPV
jgi:hypothetical protein